MGMLATATAISHAVPSWSSAEPSGAEGAKAGREQRGEGGRPERDRDRPGDDADRPEQQHVAEVAPSAAVAQACEPAVEQPVARGGSGLRPGDRGAEHERGALTLGVRAPAPQDQGDRQDRDAYRDQREAEADAQQRDEQDEPHDAERQSGRDVDEVAPAAREEGAGEGDRHVRNRTTRAASLTRRKPCGFGVGLAPPRSGEPRRSGSGGLGSSSSPCSATSRTTRQASRACARTPPACSSAPPPGRPSRRRPTATRSGRRAPATARRRSAPRRSRSRTRARARAAAARPCEVGHARAAEQRSLSGPPVGDPLHVALELAAVELFLRHSPRIMAHRWPGRKPRPPPSAAVHDA